MSKSEHPTIRWWQERGQAQPAVADTPLDADALRELCLQAGADDVGFIEIDRPEIAHERADILTAFPRAKTLISFVCRMNPENVRSPMRSIANTEFHASGEEINQVGRNIVERLTAIGIRAVNPSVAFPQEMDRYPGKVWIISFKIVAVAAGLGQMGLHRNVIHPKFGNFIVLGVVLIGAEVTRYDRPIEYNPCIDCQLCVAACPVGAISTDGHFNFAACYTHNYREFMGGFTDWAETIAESKNAREYRHKVSDSETASIWQSLSFKANYKAAYCLAACPAGEDVIGAFLSDRPGFVRETVKPLQDKQETLYVIPGSDAEVYAAKRFPHKTLKRVSSGIRPQSIAGFLYGLPLLFQRDRAGDLNATYHFTFTGTESSLATVVIANKQLQVLAGHTGNADLIVTADSQTWLAFLTKERNIVWELIRRKIRVKGDLKLLQAFGRCFPS